MCAQQSRDPLPERGGGDRNHWHFEPKVVAGRPWALSVVLNQHPGWRPAASPMPGPRAKGSGGGQGQRTRGHQTGAAGQTVPGRGLPFTSLHHQAQPSPGDLGHLPLPPPQSAPDAP